LKRRDFHDKDHIRDQFSFVLTAELEVVHSMADIVEVYGIIERVPLADNFIGKMNIEMSNHIQKRAGKISSSYLHDIIHNFTTVKCYSQVTSIPPVSLSG
jgi:hypothetical protein